MRIITVIGARPQFIKAAAVSREIAKHKGIEEIIIHTGQHFDNNMSDIFFEEMQIPKPAYNLNINSLNHGAMTGQMLGKIEHLLLEEKPDVVLVYGDTNSTLAGSLSAAKLHIKVAHVEAGLRSFNMNMPEEINRILTDRISDFLFCPTQTAINNLKQEGFDNFKSKIVLSGDVMYDAALFYSKLSSEKSDILVSMNLNKFILCTIHRAENTDDINNLCSIINALNKINETIPVILPLHPRTRGIIKKHHLNINVNVVDPVGYFDMIELLKNCSLVMTDSGGLQKEAYFFEKHCVTLRNETEWTELVDHGFNTLAGSDEKLIVEKSNTMLDKKSDFSARLYGSGDASKLIIEELLR